MATHDLPTRGTKRKSDSHKQLDDPTVASQLKPGLTVDNSPDELKEAIQAQSEATNTDPARGSHVKLEPTDIDSDSDSDGATLHDPSDEIMNPHDLADLSYKLRILPVPEDGDNLEDTAQKLQAMAQVVQAGDSLALFTGLQLSSAPHGRGRGRNPEELARSQMTPQERMLYDAWRRMKRQKREHSSSVVGNATSDENAPPTATGTGTGTMSLPPFDWEANRAPLPGAHSEKRFAQRAAAMDVVFEHQGATPEHAVWLTFHMAHFLPLIKAVARVMNSQRIHEQDSRTGLTDMEAKELETVQRAIYVAERNRCRELERIRRMTRSIAESVEIIKSRIRALER